ncbi:MAG: MarR family winged helix-turn-helix transcriptional regulator [Hyphomicrobiaceae bacterium]
MADLISETVPVARPPLSNGAEDEAETSGHNPDILAFIELLFFAYRDFVRDPDGILEEFGFGRAHHRVLHFIYRHPGIRVARLLDVLNITKQSLARVLRQLIEDGYVLQRTGENDRRERRLFLTDAGVELADRLMAPQIVRVGEALAASGPEGNKAVEKFLCAMIAEPERAAIRDLIEDGAQVGKPKSEAA